MSPQDFQNPKKLFDAFEVFILVPEQEPVPARIMDIGFRSVSLAIRAREVPTNGRGSLQLMVKSPFFSAPVEALCRVQNSVTEGDVTVARLDVVDWIGLREQLPPNLRKLLSLREVERYEPQDSVKLLVHCKVLNFDEYVPLFDLSINGLSVLVPDAWSDRMQKGDRIDLEFTLPGNEEAMQIIGVVCHVSYEDDRIYAGVRFDGNLTSRFLHKQLRLMKFVDELRET